MTDEKFSLTMQRMQKNGHYFFVNNVFSAHEFQKSIQMQYTHVVKTLA